MDKLQFQALKICITKLIISIFAVKMRFTKDIQRIMSTFLKLCCHVMF